MAGGNEYISMHRRIYKYQLLAQLNSSELVARVLPGAAAAEDTDSPESRRRPDRALKPLELIIAVFHIRKSSASRLNMLRMVCSSLYLIPFEMERCDFD